jgi:hypothetical protein
MSIMCYLTHAVRHHTTRLSLKQIHQMMRCPAKKIPGAAVLAIVVAPAYESPVDAALLQHSDLGAAGV